MYAIVPFIHNWVNSVEFTSGPNGQTSASYSGIGDITAVAKYNLLPEADYWPAVTGVGGFAGISHRSCLRASTRRCWAGMPSAPVALTSSPASTCTNG